MKYSITRTLILLNYLIVMPLAPVRADSTNSGDSASSLDALLNQASQALDANQPQSNPTVPENSMRRVSKRPQKRAPAAKPDSVPATPVVNSPPKPLQPIDAARVSEILSLDLQAQERERVVRNRGIQVRLGAGFDWLPPVYETEKDDDTFRVSTDARLSGITAEATAQIPIESPVAALPGGSTMFWGLSAAAGYFQGDATIARRGVINEDRSYPYQLVSTDGGLTLGWSSASQAAAGFRVWLNAGYGADIVRQLGDGHFDTFASVFHGTTFAVGSAVRTSSNYELFIQYRQRGSIDSAAAGPDQSKLAGQMLTTGLGIPISG